MVNSIDWGQVSNNNDINWGQSASNSISFASIYANSYSPETEIFANEIKDVLSLISRMSKDSGTVFEAKQCLINLIENI